MNAILTIDRTNGFVKASTKSSAFQLFNEGAVNKKDIEKWPVEVDKWYPINGWDKSGNDCYGIWVLDNLFNCHKSNELILTQEL